MFVDEQETYIIVYTIRGVAYLHRQLFNISGLKQRLMLCGNLSFHIKKRKTRLITYSVLMVRPEGQLMTHKEASDSQKLSLELRQRNREQEFINLQRKFLLTGPSLPYLVYQAFVCQVIIRTNSVNHHRPTTNKEYKVIKAAGYTRESLINSVEWGVRGVRNSQNVFVRCIMSVMSRL